MISNWQMKWWMDGWMDEQGMKSISHMAKHKLRCEIVGISHTYSHIHNICSRNSRCIDFPWWRTISSSLLLFNFPRNFVKSGLVIPQKYYEDLRNIILKIKVWLQEPKLYQKLLSYFLADILVPWRIKPENLFSLQSFCLLRWTHPQNNK